MLRSPVIARPWRIALVSVLVLVFACLCVGQTVYPSAGGEAQSNQQNPLERARSAAAHARTAVESLINHLRGRDMPAARTLRP